jgi:hypothetical protein
MKTRGLVFDEATLKKMGAIKRKTGGNMKNKAPNTTNDLSIFKDIQNRKRRVKEKGMNKTELEFSKILDKAQEDGDILRWQFEEVSLKIAPSTRYIPDFIAVLPSGYWQVFEIKGHLEDDAAVKFKAAAEKYPEISFHMLKKQRGQWITVYNLPSRLICKPPQKSKNLTFLPKKKKIK